MHRVGHPAPVLGEQRLIQMELVADPEDLGGIGVDAAGERARRVAGHEEHEGVDPEGDEQQ